MPCKVIAACKDELRIRNCGLGHLPVEEFVKSQWQSRTKSTIFLLYRLALAIFFTAVVINSIVVAVTSEEKYYIYLTNWGILLCMATSVMGAALVAYWYFHPDYSDKICNCEEMPCAFKVYWMMHNITLILSICITIIYWAILHTAETIVDANNVLKHATNCVFMVLDLVIVAYPVRIWHVIQPICFGLLYCLFSAIYFLCDGTDAVGNPFIYNVLDWRSPGKAMITVVGTIILAVVFHVLMFFLYKLRTFLYVRYFNPMPMLPTNTTVYGLRNQGFTSTEKY